MAMGQATGTAAAIAIGKGLSVQQVDPDEVVACLQSQGVRGLGGVPLQGIVKLTETQPARREKPRVAYQPIQVEF